MPRLAICIPLYKNVSAKFFSNFITRLMEMIVDLNDWKIDVIMVTSTIIDKARNELVEKALDRKCDYILFLDSDSIIPKNAFQKLLSLDADISSGIYFLKSRPYLPVMIKDVDKVPSYIEVINFGEVYEVDAVGMGYCLIRSKVFEKIDKPYFKFDLVKLKNGKELEISEDVYFSRKCKKAGMKILVDTGVIVGHDGGTITDFEYRAYKPNIQMFHGMKEKCVRDATEFLGLPYAEICENIKFGVQLYADEFNKFFRDKEKTPENLFEFYRTAKNGIYDLISWHYTTEHVLFDLQLVEYIKEKYPNKDAEILDFGCGLGANAILFAEAGYRVTATDIDGVSFEFCKFRCKKNDIKMDFVSIPFSKKFEKKFDVIIALDVLEHIHDSEFEQTIELIKSLKKPSGEVIITAPFGTTLTHPMHFETSKEKEKLLREL